MSREWTAKWIGPAEGDQAYPVIFKDFYIDDQVKKATLYITGLGIFEAYVNGQRVGTEYLTPYQSADAKKGQYFSYDVTDLLNCGPESEANSIDVFLGKGWDDEGRFALKAEFEIEVYKHAAEFAEEPVEEEIAESVEAPVEEAAEEAIAEAAVVEEVVPAEEAVEEAAPEIIEEPAAEEAVPENIEEPVAEETVEEVVEEAIPAAIEEPAEEVAEEAAPSVIEEPAEEVAEEAAPAAIEEPAEEVAEEAAPAVIEEPAEEVAEETAVENEVIEGLDDLLSDDDFDEIFDDGFLEEVLSEEEDTETIRETIEAGDIELLAMRGEELVGPAEEPFELDDLNDLDDFLERVIDVPKPQPEQMEQIREVQPVVTNAMPKEEAWQEKDNSADVEADDDDMEIFDFEDWDEETKPAAYEAPKPAFHEEIAEIETEPVVSPGSDIEIAPYSITDAELEALFDSPVTEEAEPEVIQEEEPEVTSEEVWAEEPEVIREDFTEADLGEDDLFSDETLDELFDETVTGLQLGDELPEDEIEDATEGAVAEEEPIEEGLVEAEEEPIEEGLVEAEEVLEETAEPAEEVAAEIEEPAEEVATEIEEPAEETVEEIEEPEEEPVEEAAEEIEAVEEAAAPEEEILGLAALEESIIEEAAEPAAFEAEPAEELSGETETFIIASDETWGYYASDIEFSSISAGEVFNRLLWENEENPEKSTVAIDLDIEVVERTALPVIVKERLEVKDVFYTLDGDPVLDFGQSFSGFVTFNSALSKGTKVHLSFADSFAEGVFEEEENTGFTYISDGMPEVVGPHFTYFTGRYVKVAGWEGEIEPKDFVGCMIYSDMQRTGYVMTSNERLNAVYDELLSGQKRSSVVMPEEGAPEDVFAYAPAAAYNMNVEAFLNQYLKGLSEEPASDRTAYAPQIIWNLYQMYGEEEILSENYELMRSWVDAIDAKDAERIEKHFLYDFETDTDAWLSMDQETETEFIASACYYEAANIVSKAANVLGREQDAFQYGRLARKIKQAFLEEYYTGAGRLSIDTQTAYVLALQYGLYVDRERVAEALKKRLAKDGGGVKCAPAAAPYICKVLADNGMSGQAYDLLLDEEQKSFNNEVEFIYAYMAGIKPLEPGFKTIGLAPVPDGRLDFCMSSFNSPAGTIVSNWTLNEDGSLNFHFEVPEGASAKITLPHYPVCAAYGNEVVVKQGSYDYAYMPSVVLRPTQEDASAE